MLTVVRLCSAKGPGWIPRLLPSPQPSPGRRCCLGEPLETGIATIKLGIENMPFYIIDYVAPLNATMETVLLRLEPDKSSRKDGINPKIRKAGKASMLGPLYQLMLTIRQSKECLNLESGGVSLIVVVGLDGLVDQTFLIKTSSGTVI